MNMNNKDMYIKLMLAENIKIANDTIDELKKEIEEINTLPNDCTGIDIDGMTCENKDYKIDILTNHYHVIGYMECLRAKSQEILELFDMTDVQFEEYLVEQEEIEKHNQEEMEKLWDMFDKSND